MPKLESKAKDWLREAPTYCLKCGCEATVMVDVDERRRKLPPVLCDTCKTVGDRIDGEQAPEDWQSILSGKESENYGQPRSLTMGEIAILSQAGAITPLLPGALMCPAFGIFCIQVLTDEGGAAWIA